VTLLSSHNMVMVQDMVFTGKARPLGTDDDGTSSEYDNPDDIKRNDRRERRLTARKMKEIMAEEYAYKKKFRASMKQPGAKLLSRNKFASLDDPEAPPLMTLADWEASNAFHKPPLRIVPRSLAQGHDSDPPPGYEHVTLVKDKPTSSQ
jgi:hypothetical protein